MKKLVKIIINCKDRGLFSILIESMHAIDLHSRLGNVCDVDISSNNVYYDDKFALEKNVWKYYFIGREMIDQKDCIVNINKFVNTQKIWCRLHYKRMNSILNKLIKDDIKSYLFKQCNYVDINTIGVHVRRTDHYKEVSQVSLAEYEEAIKLILLNGKYSKLFICTDDVNVIDYFLIKFKGYKCIYNNFERSNNDTSIHLNKYKSSGYKLGLEAIIDSFMLSRCGYGVLSDSNFSYAALMHNPNLKYKLLQKKDKNNIVFHLKNGFGKKILYELHILLYMCQEYIRRFIK